jgi:2-methylisocitrate lyase-like PEP mutase family enzyme
MTKNQQFRKLHTYNEMFHIGNVWDIKSAMMMEKMGYKAIGTSSMALADNLGFEDGENISFDTLLDIVKGIISKVDIPVSVDMENGYSSDTNEIIENIVKLYECGVVGINLEDSNISSNRTMIEAIQFSDKIKKIKDYLTNHVLIYF